VQMWIRLIESQNTGTGILLDRIYKRNDNYTTSAAAAACVCAKGAMSVPETVWSPEYVQCRDCRLE